MYREAVSVYTLDVSTPVHAKVISKTKTGVLVGERVDGIPALSGSAPNSIVANQRHVFVSNGKNDSITVLDLVNQQRLTRHPAASARAAGSSLRGIIPFGLALSPDGKRLYVAEAGINAVGVIDTQTFAVLGHLSRRLVSQSAGRIAGRQVLVRGQRERIGIGAERWTRRRFGGSIGHRQLDARDDFHFSGTPR